MCFSSKNIEHYCTSLKWDLLNWKRDNIIFRVPSLLSVRFKPVLQVTRAMWCLLPFWFFHFGIKPVVGQIIHISLAQHRDSLSEKPFHLLKVCFLSGAYLLGWRLVKNNSFLWISDAEQIKCLFSWWFSVTIHVLFSLKEKRTDVFWCLVCSRCVKNIFSFYCHNKYVR